MQQVTIVYNVIDRVTKKTQSMRQSLERMERQADQMDTTLSKATQNMQRNLKRQVEGFEAVEKSIEDVSHVQATDLHRNMRETNNLIKRQTTLSNGLEQQFHSQIRAIEKDVKARKRQGALTKAELADSKERIESWQEEIAAQKDRKKQLEYYTLTLQRAHAARQTVDAKQRNDAARDAHADHAYARQRLKDAKAVHVSNVETARKHRATLTKSDAHMKRVRDSIAYMVDYEKEWTNALEYSVGKMEQTHRQMNRNVNQLKDYAHETHRAAQAVKVHDQASQDLRESLVAQSQEYLNLAQSTENHNQELAKNIQQARDAEEAHNSLSETLRRQNRTVLYGERRIGNHTRGLRRTGSQMYHTAMAANVMGNSIRIVGSEFDMFMGNVGPWLQGSGKLRESFKHVREFGFFTEGAVSGLHFFQTLTDILAIIPAVAAALTVLLQVVGALATGIMGLVGSLFRMIGALAVIPGLIQAVLSGFLALRVATSMFGGAARGGVEELEGIADSISNVQDALNSARASATTTRAQQATDTLGLRSATRTQFGMRRDLSDPQEASSIEAGLQRQIGLEKQLADLKADQAEILARMPPLYQEINDAIEDVTLAWRQLWYEGQRGIRISTAIIRILTATSDLLRSEEMINVVRRYAYFFEFIADHAERIFGDPSFRRGVQTIFEGAILNMEKLTDLLVALGPYIRELMIAFNLVTTFALDRMIDRLDRAKTTAEEFGQKALRFFMQGVDTFVIWGRSIRNIVSGFRTLADGGGLVDRFEQGLLRGSERFKAWAESIEEGHLHSFFDGSIEILKALGRLLRDIGRLIADVLMDESSVATTVAFFDTIGSQIRRMGGFMNEAWSTIGPNFIRFIEAMVAMFEKEGPGIIKAIDRVVRAFVRFVEITDKILPAGFLAWLVAARTGMWTLGFFVGNLMTPFARVLRILDKMLWVTLSFSGAVAVLARMPGIGHIFEGINKQIGLGSVLSGGSAIKLPTPGTTTATVESIRAGTGMSAVEHGRTGSQRVQGVVHLGRSQPQERMAAHGMAIGGAGKPDSFTTASKTSQARLAIGQTVGPMYPTAPIGKATDYGILSEEMVTKMQRGQHPVRQGPRFGPRDPIASQATTGTRPSQAALGPRGTNPTTVPQVEGINTQQFRGQIVTGERVFTRAPEEIKASGRDRWKGMNARKRAAHAGGMVRDIAKRGARGYARYTGLEHAGRTIRGAATMVRHPSQAGDVLRGGQAVVRSGASNVGGGITKMLSGAGNAFKALLTPIQTLRKGFTTISTAMGPVGWAIQGVISFITVLIDNTMGVRDRLVETFKIVGGPLVDAFKGFFSALGMGSSGSGGLLADMLKVLDFIVKVIGVGLVEAFRVAFAIAVPPLTFLIRMFTAVLDLVNDIWAALKLIFTPGSFQDGVKALGAAFVNLAKSVLTGIGELLRGWFDGIMAGVVDLFWAGLSSIIDAINKINPFDDIEGPQGVQDWRERERLKAADERVQSVLDEFQTHEAISKELKKQNDLVSSMAQGSDYDDALERYIALADAADHLARAEQRAELARSNSELAAQQAAAGASPADLFSGRVPGAGAVPDHDPIDPNAVRLITGQSEKGNQIEWDDSSVRRFKAIARGISKEFESIEKRIRDLVDRMIKYPERRLGAIEKAWMALGKGIKDALHAALQGMLDDVNEVLSALAQDPIAVKGFSKSGSSSTPAKKAGPASTASGDSTTGTGIPAAFTGIPGAGSIGNVGMLKELKSHLQPAAMKILESIPGAKTLTSVLRQNAITSSNNVSQHALGEAMDFVLPTKAQMASAGAWIQQNAAAFGVNPSQVFYPGRGAAGPDHEDHVHVGFGSGAGTGDITALLGLSGLEAPKNIGKGAMGTIATALAHTVFESLSSMGMSFGAFEGQPTSGAGASAAPTALIEMIHWAAKQYGAKGDGLVRVADKESSFNTSAMNNWDSNAAKGTPSGGLFQFIQPTYGSFSALAKAANPGAWAGVQDHWMDPTAQSLTAAWAFANGLGSHWATANWYGNGGDFIAKRPQLIGVGDKQPERVTVTPTRGPNKGGGGRGEVTLIFNNHTEVGTLVANDEGIEELTEKIGEQLMEDIKTATRMLTQDLGD